MFMAMGGDFLGESGGPLVGFGDGGDGDGLLDPLTDLIGKINDLVKFTLGGGDFCPNLKGAGEVERTIDFFGFTIGKKPGKLNWGGHGESSLNRPHGAAGA
jgi:hypothetical protein